MDTEYMYQPVDLEDELFLSEIPIHILMSAIKTQFDEPLEYKKKDYVQSFITKYTFTKEELLEDDLIDLENNRDEFLRFMLTMFEEYLNVGFVDFDQLSEDDQHEMLHITYRFFMKNIKRNFVNVIFNYIKENKATLSGRYEKKKDVTAMNFKDEIGDEYDTLILSNLADVIEDVLQIVKESNDIFKFLRLCDSGEPCLELQMVDDWFHEFTLTGNFIEKYVDMIDDDFLIEIQSKLRNRILKKYPYRKRKESGGEDQIEVESEG